MWKIKIYMFYNDPYSKRNKLCLDSVRTINSIILLIILPLLIKKMKQKIFTEETVAFIGK